MYCKIMKRFRADNVCTYVTPGENTEIMERLKSSLFPSLDLFLANIMPYANHVV
jgi:hypothetical protein